MLSLWPCGLPPDSPAFYHSLKSCMWCELGIVYRCVRLCLCLSIRDAMQWIGNLPEYHPAWAPRQLAEVKTDGAVGLPELRSEREMEVLCDLASNLGEDIKLSAQGFKHGCFTTSPTRKCWKLFKAVADTAGEWRLAATAASGWSVTLQLLSYAAVPGALFDEDDRAGEDVCGVWQQ